MSLKKITIEDVSALSQKETLAIAIDNGDLKALQGVVDKWGFIDAENALRFALAILVISSDDKKIHVLQNGVDRNVVPANSLMKQKEPEKPELTTQDE